MAGRQLTPRKLSQKWIFLGTSKPPVRSKADLYGAVIAWMANFPYCKSFNTDIKPSELKGETKIDILW